jgi:hypothetical protein
MSKQSLSIPPTPLFSSSYLIYGIKIRIKQLQEDINRIERKLNNLTNNGKRKTCFDKEEKKRRKNKRKLVVKQRLKEERDLIFIRWI